MIRRFRFLGAGFGALLAGCAPSPPPDIDSVSIPSRDPLYEPARVTPGRLEYAPDRTTFAPILTEKFAYATQTEANDAYRRLLAATPQVGAADSVWLFGNKPGALDAQTALVARYREPFIHCATDLLDASRRRVVKKSGTVTADSKPVSSGFPRPRATRIAPPES